MMKRHETWLCGLAIFYLGVAATAAGSHPVPAREALALIDDAAGCFRRTPGFEVTTYATSGERTITTKRTVLNAPDHRHFVRVEETITDGPGASRRKVLLENESGAWQLNDRREARRLRGDTLAFRDIPLRLQTASELELTNALAYTVDSDATCFGAKCTCVTIELTSAAIERLRASPAMLEEAAARRRKQLGLDSRRPDVREVWADLAPRLFPARYVYYIDATHNFIRRWSAYSVKGDKVDEVNYHELRILPELQVHDFDIPSEYFRIPAK